MLKPTFALTKKIPLTILRRGKPTLVRGKWVEAEPTKVEVEVNIQPLKVSELMLLPESSRVRQWYKLYCADEIRTGREGDDGHAPDQFVFQGDLYEVMKAESYSMGILNHWKVLAARVELSPN